MAWSFTVEHRLNLPAGCGAGLRQVTVDVTGAEQAPHAAGCLLRLRLVLCLHSGRRRLRLRLRLARVLAAVPPAHWQARVLGYHLEAGGRMLALTLALHPAPPPAPPPRTLVDATASAAVQEAGALSGAVLAEGTVTASVRWAASDGSLRCSEGCEAWSCLLAAPGTAPGDQAEVQVQVSSVQPQWAPGEATAGVNVALAVQGLVLRRASVWDTQGELLVPRVVARAGGSTLVRLAVPLGR